MSEGLSAVIESVTVSGPIPNNAQPAQGAVNFIVNSISQQLYGCDASGCSAMSITSQHLRGLPEVSVQFQGEGRCIVTISKMSTAEVRGQVVQALHAIGLS